MLDLLRAAARTRLGDRGGGVRPTGGIEFRAYTHEVREGRMGGGRLGDGELSTVSHKYSDV